MPDIVFDGGPQDGKRSRVPDSPYRAITVAYLKPMPLVFPDPPPPRPKWWRHPVRWLRWKPPPPPVIEMPEMRQLTYRDTGKVRDGARVYEIDGDWWSFKGPEADGASLMQGMLTALHAVHPAIRRDPRTRWVMSPEWYCRVRMEPWPPFGALDDERVMGIEVKITDDGGKPHLENRAYPADYP